MAAAAFALAMRVGPGHAQEASPDTTILGDLPPLPDDLADKANYPPAPYTETAPVGTAKPLDSEIKTAYALLTQSPFQTTPLNVAQYFLSIGAGAYGRQYRPYAREWPERANPIIYHFFSATLTRPQGDATAWCAAFLNWCLLRAKAVSPEEIGKAPGHFSESGKPFPDANIKNFSTNSASSGSFRCWTATDAPRPGELAVFKNAGTDSMTPVCLGQGHIAFFLSVPRPGFVRVLGGTQTAAGSGGAVTIADMSTQPGSRFMKYVRLKEA
jgi:hypothetical protein